MRELESTYSWNSIFMAMATTIAMKSKDPVTKVGAVLVSPDKKRISIGYNGFPSDIPNYDEWWTTRGLDVLGKDTLSKHAEDNCFDNVNCDVTGWDLYVTHHPCFRCAGKCVHRKLNNVYYRFDVKPQYNPQLAKQILDLGRVSLIRFH